ncbi:MAG: ABC transporter permease subunit [Thermomicrobiales bacterium]
MKTFALFSKTLRDVRGATIGIALLVGGMAVVDLLIYPSYRDSLKNFQMPEAMAGFLGEASDVSSPQGFITAEFFSWIPLVLLILAIAGGTAAFAGEEGSGTLDLLLSQPIKRWELAAAKAAALGASIAIAALAALVGFAIGKSLVEFEISLGRLFEAALYMLPVAFLFLGLSLLASATLPSRGSAAMVITGIAVIAYFIQILGEAAPVLKRVRNVSPFYWSEPSRVIVNGFDWVRAGTMLMLAFVAVMLAMFMFERREISSGAREWHMRPSTLRNVRLILRRHSTAPTRETTR